LVVRWTVPWAPRRASATPDAIVAWPQNAISARGVKYLTRAESAVIADRKAVSLKPRSAAIARILSSDKPSASTTTPAGLPEDVSASVVVKAR
jgi:hypothetical protein